MLSPAMLTMLKNLLCQFRSDSNQQREVARYSSVLTGGLPSCTCSLLKTSTPPLGCSQTEARNRTGKAC